MALNRLQQETHRPGVLKQQNKSHKHGKHRSKGAVDTANKGKVPIKLATRKTKHDLKKLERRNQITQMRAQKREATLAKKRGLGGQGSPPFLTEVISLTSSENEIKHFIDLLKNCDEDAVVTENSLGHWHISVPRFKQRFTFALPQQNNILAILDLAKVADTVLFLYSSTEEIDKRGETILASLFAQGLPSTVHVVLDIGDLNVKKRGDVKKKLSKLVEKRFPKEKLHYIQKPCDGLLILRQIGTQKQRKISHRDRRAHLLAENIDFEFDERKMSYILKISGYVRGQSLSVNGLVHLPGMGDFQLLQILGPPDPYPFQSANSKGKNLDVSMEKEEVKELETANPKLQETLQSENIPDPLDAEQTWPTEEEMEEADKNSIKKKIVKQVPKGTSEYQAAWIVDCEEVEVSDDDNDDEGIEDLDDEIAGQMGELGVREEESSEDEECEVEEEYETLTITEGGDLEKYDERMDLDEEQLMLEKFKEARSHELFPDEVDTPLDVPARIRFQKYRGLKSFRTSPWDPKENLPSDYARIYQFERFDNTRKRIFNEERTGALTGWYVTLCIDAVPPNIIEEIKQKKSLVVYQPLPHEQKMSVLNLAIKRHSFNNDIIKSKERLIFHVGYRRYAACPVFSQHTNGTKHKYERFLRSEMPVVATIFAPIIFPPASVLVFKELKNGQHDLIATGSVLSVNPDRIIAKRIVLSGHPFKINKKSAVVRYMFFNREDILWFKPLEIRSKCGRRGHIKEPLGTHGHMKCVFDGQLKSQDIVLMNLYKRMFPKWTYDPFISDPPPIIT